MDTLYRILIGLAALLLLAMTLWMVLSSRRERRITALSSFVSFVLSLVLLPVFILLGGTELNPWVGLPLLGLGLLLGCLGGVTARLSYGSGQVLGRNSWPFLLAWGGSLVLVQVLNLFDSALLASIGLALLFLTTGMQAGRDGTLFVRRLWIKPPPAVPQVVQTGPAAHPFPESRGIPPRFAEVEPRVAALRARYQAGEMDDAAYGAALREELIDDGAGGYWLPAAEAGEWYWHNGHEWVRRDPSEGGTT